jgi:hypothetical protein
LSLSENVHYTVHVHVSPTKRDFIASSSRLIGAAIAFGLALPRVSLVYRGSSPSGVRIAAMQSLHVKTINSGDGEQQAAKW